MKKYIAIGRFDNRNNVETVISSKYNTLKEFKQSLKEAKFIVYTALSEKHWDKVKDIDREYELYDALRKITAYCYCDNVTDYVMQHKPTINFNLEYNQSRTMTV